jgi:hypothetical protein
MYLFLDRAIADLEPGNRVLLWSMRSWVVAMATGRCPCATLGGAFARWRIQDLLRDFTMAMALLNAQGQGSMRFRAPESGHVGDDEAMLLAMFHAAAVGDGAMLQRFAAQLVQPQAEGPLLTAVVGAADVLRRAPIDRSN